MNRRSILKTLALSPLALLLPKFAAAAPIIRDDDWNSDLYLDAVNNTWCAVRPALNGENKGKYLNLGGLTQRFRIVGQSKCADHTMWHLRIRGKNVVYKVYHNDRIMNACLKWLWQCEDGEGILHWAWDDCSAHAYSAKGKHGLNVTTIQNQLA